VVAGTLGGRRLAVPGAGTRPTSDRVREAVFSTVAARMELAGAAVLDLYAGSGALGIEALSRGAERAVFVESDRRAAAVLRRNLTELGLAPGGATPGGGRTAVRACTVAAFLAAPTPEAFDAAPEAFDLVLLDPPYAVGDRTVHEVLVALAARWLASGALLVVERAAGSSIAWPSGVAPLTLRRYGDTEVHYGAAT
jgi:16S rRNA (guanine966-N2)-methyltransferase